MAPTWARVCFELSSKTRSHRPPLRSTRRRGSRLVRPHASHGRAASTSFHRRRQVFQSCSPGAANTREGSMAPASSRCRAPKRSSSPNASTSDSGCARVASRNQSQTKRGLDGVLLASRDWVGRPCDKRAIPPSRQVRRSTAGVMSRQCLLRGLFCTERFRRDGGDSALRQRRVVATVASHASPRKRLVRPCRAPGSPALHRSGRTRERTQPHVTWTD